MTSRTVPLLHDRVFTMTSGPVSHIKINKYRRIDTIKVPKSENIIKREVKIRRNPIDKFDKAGWKDLWTVKR